MAVVYQISFPNGKSYIGVSCQLTRRLKDHSKANTLIGRALRKYSGLESISILFEGCADSCFKKEEELVAMFNTISPNGYNQTGGGLGGKSLGPEAMAKRKASLRRWHDDPDNRAWLISRFNEPEHRANLKKQAHAIWNDPEKRSKHLAVRRSPEVKARRSVAMREVQGRPEVKEALRVSANKQWSDPVIRAKMIARMREVAAARRAAKHNTENQ